MSRGPGDKGGETREHAMKEKREDKAIVIRRDAPLDYVPVVVVHRVATRAWEDCHVRVLWTG